jgi:hypothetical protein
LCLPGCTATLLIQCRLVPAATGPYRDIRANMEQTCVPVRHESPATVSSASLVASAQAEPRWLPLGTVPVRYTPAAPSAPDRWTPGDGGVAGGSLPDPAIDLLYTCDVPHIDLSAITRFKPVKGHCERARSRGMPPVGRHQDLPVGGHEKAAGHHLGGPMPRALRLVVSPADYALVNQRAARSSVVLRSTIPAFSSVSRDAVNPSRAGPPSGWRMGTTTSTT